MSVDSVVASTDQSHNLARKAPVWLFIVLLLWAPFPLGGAIAWASGLQEMAVSFCWMLWFITQSGPSSSKKAANKAVMIPFWITILVICWALLQSIPVVPSDWIHPIWSMAADALGAPLRGTISLNPWRTEAEALKLASYVMAGFMVYQMARRSNNAEIILNAIIAVCAVYATYAFVLELSGLQQSNLFYSVPYRGLYISGPFMLHNSFASFTGLGAIAAITKFFTNGSRGIILRGGAWQYINSMLQFSFGRGAPLLLAFLVTLGACVASASRAGFAATVLGLFAVGIISTPLIRTNIRARTVGVALAIASPLLLVVVLGADTLAGRISQLFSNDAGDIVRPLLWSAANRMITDAPLLGLGLGSFEDAYPLYATTIFPKVMDKAHCDYLEFAAGVGLPAAIVWWSVIAWFSALCARAVLVRQRNRLYPIAAVGATVLVAVHSSVDFSLQMPAVALLYATFLGLGVAQCQSTRT